jgi:uncharacterized membrane protein
VLAGVLLLFAIPWQPAALLGWDVAAIYFLTRTWKRVLPLDPRQVRDVATREDPSRATADLILLLASVVSIAGVGFTLIEAAGAKGAATAALLVLAVSSLLSSWLVVHTVFTLRYARLYYADTTGGISFNQDDPPVYSDFAYLAFTIGMTFQVSDTDIGDREIRSMAIRHALISYLFGAVLLAMTVNVGASLLK